MTSPRLLIKSDDIPGLKAKLGTSTIRGSIGIALTSTLNGQRSETTVTAINAALAGSAGQSHANAALLVDLQWAYLTDAERSTFRASLLGKADAIYKQSTATPRAWWFDDRQVNNWTYYQAGSPLQVMLYAGLLFDDDPRSAGFVSEGLRLYDAVLCGGPNDGVYDRVGKRWATRPTVVDCIDESLFSPCNYGLWGTGYFAELNTVLGNSGLLNPYEAYGRAFLSEARLWTYRLGAMEGINFYNDFDSFAGYFGQLGHGKYQHIGVYSNRPILLLAAAYGDPVLAWHYYANPSGFVQPLANNATYEGAYGRPLAVYDDWIQFLAWGAVSPQHPADAGWPLVAFWPNAGVAVIRKSWHKNRRVAPPGVKTGLVLIQAGPGGSKDRPGACGAVQYESDDAVILGCGPYAGSGNTGTWDHYLTVHASVNNTLFVDEASQSIADNLALMRCRHGSATRLGESTFLADMGPRTAPDFLAAYPGLAAWTRKVHYDRAADILWIKDVARATDGKSHRFRWNWNTTNPVMTTPSEYVLPAGYTMLAISLVDGVPMAGEIRTWTKPHDDLVAAMAANPNLKPTYTPESLLYSTIYAGLDATEARVVWAVGKDRAALSAYLHTHRGAFIRIRSLTQDDSGLTIDLTTDEPTAARLYRDGDAPPDWSAVETSHRLALGLGTVPITAVVEAMDSHGDVTRKSFPFLPVPLA